MQQSHLFLYDTKRQLLEGLDEVIQSVTKSEKFFIGGEFNGHAGAKGNGYNTTHRSFDHGGETMEGWLF